jgi:hypothetical protein
MAIGLDPRVARVARRLGAAAERYDAPVVRVALRALRLRAGDGGSATWRPSGCWTPP